MYCLSKEDMYRINPIFDNWNETMIWSCLQGYMGTAWTDDVKNPKSAQIIVGDFCFFDGIPSLDLVKNIPDYYRAPCILMVPGSDEWGTLIEQEYKDNYHKFMRYAFKKESRIFNTERLQSYIKKLSVEYKIQRVDEKIFNNVKREQWSKDLCSQFSSYNEYKKIGLGFVITHNSDIVCGASSYTVYNEGIEIEIDTKEEYRRKGLALACASKLILECLKKNIYPSWDSANKESAALAKKLGYNFESEYSTYEITNFRQDH
ncbi:GNAT family N-acetyltransferase [Clostridium vincentii]|uniref:GNAT acetyltransferase n=1 Tax=Clostridium vincentii TaxID=52704 RepID=A0A2T0BDH1_9CLOT|nr:GNAT family N-acetyltransferase [Clostridium vincentii]PRR81883.1 GNAT acetyltransferase [Clostridium vincentii]